MHRAGDLVETWLVTYLEQFDLCLRTYDVKINDEMPLKLCRKMSQKRVYEGGCHCGAVRFQVLVDQYKADNCNCSICQKKGFLHLIVPPERFTLLQGADVLTTYRFNTGVAQHMFCRVCGIHPFYRPRSHPDCIDVNVRCLDGDVLSDFEVIPFDGANWEENIHKLRSE